MKKIIGFLQKYNPFYISEDENIYTKKDIEMIKSLSKKEHKRFVKSFLYYLDNI